MAAALSATRSLPSPPGGFPAAKAGVVQGSMRVDSALNVVASSVAIASCHVVSSCQEHVEQFRALRGVRHT